MTPQKEKSQQRNAAHLIAVQAALALMDVAATLLGQPRAYWQGDLQAATDAFSFVAILVIKLMHFQLKDTNRDTADASTS